MAVLGIEVMTERDQILRRFYRCIEKLPLTLGEFESDAAKGEDLPPPRTPERERIFEGISVYSDLERARWRAKKLTPPCAWIAVLQIRPGGPITVEKTFKDPAHYTLWGDAQAITDCVESLVGVDPHPAEGR